MKILFLTKYYPPSEGGIERYSHLLCTGLVQRGLQVEVVAAAEESRVSRTEEIDGVRVHRMGSLGEVRGVAISPRLPALVRKLVPNFDLVHLNFPNPLMELAYLAFCRQQNAILSYHSDIFRQRILLQIYSPFIHRLLKQVSAIIASSPNYVDSSPFLSQHRERCRFIPYPVDTESLWQVDWSKVDSLKRQYGKFVLFVGRLVYYKGLQYLIEATRRLQGTRLIIVGKGPLEGAYRTQVESLGLNERVSFLGKINDENLKVLYHACQCFVLPSVARSEAFGIVLAEAMACERPVISTELSTGTSFVNQNGETGFVVPPGDVAALAEKIDLLFRNEELQKSMGRKARIRIEGVFRKEATIDSTIRLYDEVMASSGAHRH